jgi:hypothetical protein
VAGLRLPGNHPRRSQSSSESQGSASGCRGRGHDGVKGTGGQGGGEGGTDTPKENDGTLFSTLENYARLFVIAMLGIHAPGLPPPHFALANNLPS